MKKIPEFVKWHKHYAYTVLPTKADHDVIVCLHLYQKFTFMIGISMYYIHQVVIAQLVAHRISNHLVLGSIPAGNTFFKFIFSYSCVCVLPIFYVYFVLYIMYIIKASVSYMLQNAPAVFVSYETKLFFKRCTCHIKIRVMPIAIFCCHIWDKRGIRLLENGFGFYIKQKIN